MTPVIPVRACDTGTGKRGRVGIHYNYPSIKIEERDGGREGGEETVCDLFRGEGS